MNQPAATVPAMKDIVALCKRRGFIFAASDIYGGINGFWDYGPLGVELKNNLRDLWWKSMVTARQDVVGLDSSVILPPSLKNSHISGMVSFQFFQSVVVISLVAKRLPEAV